MRPILLSRWSYYLSSIPTLLLKIRNWPAVVLLFLGLPVSRPLVIRLKTGCRFKVRTRMDVWIIKETCLDRDYERGTVAIEEGWTVLDIGAGFGDFSICVARRHPLSNIYAFEPLPDSLALLEENLQLNGVQNVRRFPWAVGGAAGILHLRTATGRSGQHTTTPAAGEGREAIPVTSVTLDQIFAELGLERCDFLKIDCEGAEYDILLHASEKTLRRIRHVAMEYHDGVTAFSHGDLVRLFETNGFVVRTRPNPAHRGLGFLFASNRLASV
ncbi:MAG TPA: FkbM family methyltransferase [Thermoanaerobaculia bacterium]|nr:FkbM family methyltransferase [Thermoanaerobaculia bacterium]